MNFVETKRQLHFRCQEIINERIAAAKQAMDDAQASANQEDKSSAGDKYETGRAMAQIARDQAAEQLDEALQLKNVLDRIAGITTSDKVGLGNMVITTHNRFYVSVSIGKILLGDDVYFALSPQSPMGKVLMGRAVGDTILFNRQQQNIEGVY